VIDGPPEQILTRPGEKESSDSDDREGTCILQTWRGGKLSRTIFISIYNY
jgi:hypothetical protein